MMSFLKPKSMLVLVLLELLTRQAFAGISLSMNHPRCEKEFELGRYDSISLSSSDGNNSIQKGIQENAMLMDINIELKALFTDVVSYCKKHKSIANYSAPELRFEKLSSAENQRINMMVKKRLAEIKKADGPCEKDERAFRNLQISKSIDISDDASGGPGIDERGNYYIKIGTGCVVVIDIATEIAFNAKSVPNNSIQVPPLIDPSTGLPDKENLFGLRNDC